MHFHLGTGAEATPHSSCVMTTVAWASQADHRLMCNKSVGPRRWSSSATHWERFLEDSAQWANTSQLSNSCALYVHPCYLHLQRSHSSVAALSIFHRTLWCLGFPTNGSKAVLTKKHTVLKWNSLIPVTLKWCFPESSSLISYCLESQVHGHVLVSLGRVHFVFWLKGRVKKQPSVRGRTCVRVWKWVQVV